MLDAVAHAKSVRERLRNPPNAVPDAGINLKRAPEEDVAQEVSIAPLVPAEPRYVAIRAELRRKTEEINALREELRQLGVYGVTIEDVQVSVCCFCPVSVIDLKSSRRTETVVLPRQIAFWLSKKHTIKSLPQIGKAFGGRDHTTVLHGIRKIDLLVQSDQEVAGLIAKIEAHLLSVG